MAPIAVGDKIPNVTLTYLDDDNNSQKFNLHEELKGKKAVLIAVPGAFTPTCRYPSSLSLSYSGPPSLPRIRSLLVHKLCPDRSFELEGFDL